ncbi:restriction endonuclease [Lactiplantibacillus modestisalitolerans]|uniref:Restriction endonuclease n=1 Tax=Lactiplantibacillus modestisalitolerans TaxID=1457219 RepID=A0ABV5WWV4_9LACO|nr:restriction endonuclease [Lactiplantibacillus modestisalitolerans]
MAEYKRRRVEKAILMALRDLGGSASRKVIRKMIADNQYDNLTYNDVFLTKQGKNGSYSPFMFDFNFGIRNLASIAMVEQLQRGKDVVLTSAGMHVDLTSFPTKRQQKKMDDYWQERSGLRKKRLAKQQISATSSVTADESDKEDTDNSNWKAELINQLMKFDPGKFESFSRLLISKMGVLIDKNRGIVRSGDHGIDGFGYFTSDEFRTSRVAIQCKRYSDNAVSEPEIDKFKGVMDGFNAEYGIFITTSHFTSNAKQKATQGSNTVTLIDGQALADLVEKYELHITPITTYTLDDYYYQDN